ncbi:LETM1-domain-containing protein [Ramicandelaber brevisporus]|nr:LETM1-domain-containing protein [Ramicandelaber brevisporus]
MLLRASASSKTARYTAVPRTVSSAIAFSGVVRSQQFGQALVARSALSTFASPSLTTVQARRRDLPLTSWSAPLGSLDHARLLSVSRMARSDDKSAPLPPSTHVEDKTVAKPAAAKKPLSVRIKEELMHYWHGTKLLWLEMKISTKLLWKMLKGHELTRREQRQLKRTTIDMGRLVPFSIFIIVPFMELLLPVAIKLFPNMMPSTYESASEREKKAKKQSDIRLEVSKLLRESMAESIKSKAAAKAAKKQQQQQQSATTEAATATTATTTATATPALPSKYADAFDVLHRTRATGEILSTDELITISKVFDDDLTLDNLTRPQLVGLCRFLGAYTFGTDNMLRKNISNKMRYLKADDRMILAEGVDELTVPELQQACAARGLPSTGASPARMRDELHHWLTLHLEHKMPSVILLLTRAFATVDPTRIKEGQTFAPEALQATLSALPDNLVNEAELKDDEKMGTATSKQKLEVLEQQEELIEDEAEQETRKDAVEADKKQQQQQQQQQQPTQPPKDKTD